MNFRRLTENVLLHTPLIKRYGNAPRLPYSWALHLDAFMDNATQGTKARLPGIGTSSALPIIGRDRRIIRGPNEPDDVYAERLRRWLDTWRIAGSPFAIMEAVRAYCYPSAVRCRVVTNNHAWYSWDENDVKSYHRPTVSNWVWDADEPTKWHRYWLIVYPLGLWQPPQNWDDPFLWGNGTWSNPGQFWDSNGLTTDTLVTLKKMVRQWGPAGPYCSHIIVAFDSASFDPYAPPSASMPDGTWDTPANRLNTATYYGVDGGV